MTDGKVANQQSMQVATMKENLNEYKFIIACVDGVLNTADPVKTAIAHAGLYTGLYVILLLANPSMLTLVSVVLALYLVVETFIGKFNEKIFASKPFTEDQEARFHSACAKMVDFRNKACQAVCCMTALKNDSPYRFLTFALPALATTAYLGKKIALSTMIWFTLIFQCACMIPQVQDKVCRMIAQVDFTKIEQKFSEIQGKINGLIKKKKPE